MKTATISAIDQERLERLAKQDAAKLEASKKNLREKYSKAAGKAPFLTEEEIASTVFDPSAGSAGKFKVTLACRSTGEFAGQEHTRYTSDLFQTGGCCDEARKGMKSESKADTKELRALMTKARANGIELMKDGKIDPKALEQVQAIA